MERPDNTYKKVPRSPPSNLRIRSGQGQTMVFQDDLTFCSLNSGQNSKVFHFRLCSLLVIVVERSDKTSTGLQKLPPLYLRISSGQGQTMVFSKRSYLLLSFQRKKPKVLRLCSLIGNCSGKTRQNLYELTKTSVVKCQN